MKIAELDTIGKFLAELIGTCFLVFIGCMGCIPLVEGIANNHLQVVLTFGLTVMFLIHSLSHISGAHFNPAVTVAAYICKLITLPLAGIYVVAQTMGGFVGFGLLKLTFPNNLLNNDNSTNGFCMTLPHRDISPLQACIIEFVATMVLILFLCAAWDPQNKDLPKDVVPLKFGLTVAAVAAAAGNWTGGSMNPARSFGPAIWSNDFSSQWIYWIAPNSAAAITSALYKVLYWRKSIPENSYLGVQLDPQSHILD